MRLRFEASNRFKVLFPGKVGEIDSVATARTDLSSGTIDIHKVAEVAVGASSGDLITSNANSSKLIMQNVHATRVIFFGLGENATADKGIAVADGETLTLPFCGAVDVVASGADTPVRVQEL